VKNHDFGLLKNDEGVNQCQPFTTFSIHSYQLENKLPAKKCNSNYFLSILTQLAGKYSTKITYLLLFQRNFMDSGFVSTHVFGYLTKGKEAAEYRLVNPRQKILKHHHQRVATLTGSSGSFKPEYADFYVVINQQLEFNSSASRILPRLRFIDKHSDSDNN